MTRKLSTGFYQPTESFKSIPEHIAVMFEDNQTLVAIVGAVDDDLENVKESMEYAKLFSAAPETLQKLSHSLATIATQAETIAKLRDERIAILTKVYGFVNHMKVNLALSPEKAFDTLNALTEYLVSVDVSEPRAILEATK